MNSMERAALKHATAQLQYERSAQARIDRAADKQARAARDKAAGHSTDCTLSRCSLECPSTPGKRW